ncbi:hypothetical protein [Nocardia crassostreae]|uniref:hypothetical protein n=1 Tax=Nocardia crassostreae TaxID=53428 RepID=UPI0008309B5B|nr:hypothetical protein [Nocardia crassostreae]
MNSYLSHDIPDYPVMNLRAAVHALAKHEACPDDCEAKRYYAKLVPHLERGRSTWNIWTAR